MKTPGPTAPTHLAALARSEEWSDDPPSLKFSLEGGSGAAFGILYETYEQGGPLKPGWPGLLTVEQAGSSWLIFDPASHGYDAIACGFRPDGPRLRHRWVCDACSGELAHVSVGLAYNNWDEPDFRQLSAEASLEDCFDWITIDLTCANCGKLWPSFLDYECA